jgi:putative addiction module killer protein
LRDGIFELRIRYGKGVRVYYTKDGQDILILLHGGADKKKQNKDIEKAIRIKEDINEKKRANISVLAR